MMTKLMLGIVAGAVLAFLRQNGMAKRNGNGA